MDLAHPDGATRGTSHAVEHAAIRIFVGLVEARHYETARHVERVSESARIVAHALGLPAETCATIREASALHDVGKLGLRDRVLLKRGTLTIEERATMQRHAQIGHRILAGSGLPLLETAAEIALTHHERIDGSGYPRGLRGGEIPIEGRITAVVDVFDALTHYRPYRPAYPIAAAVRYLAEERGRLFDEAAVDAFTASLEEILALRENAMAETVGRRPRLRQTTANAPVDESAYELA